MNPNRKNLVRLNHDVHRGRQSWHFTAVWQYGNECLKVDIKRDFYDFQSHVRAFVWSRPKMEWSPISEIHISQAECRRISTASGSISTADFQRDEEQLLDRALMVIGARSDRAGGGDRPTQLSVARTAPDSGHGPEPWTESGMAIIQDARGKIVADCDSPDSTGECDRTNARRIVAAVNACKGISTEALETDIIRDTRVALARAEFLMRRVADGDHHALENLRDAADQALAAITKLPAA